jgi:hypothetical protein
MTLQELYGTGGAMKGKAIIRARSGAVGTSYEALSGYGIELDQYSILGTAVALDITSSSTADDVGSTGATEVTVFGLDAAYNPIKEAVAMNGQTAVTTTATFHRVHGVAVTAAGTGLVNAGDIYAVATGTSTWTAGVPDTTTSAVFKLGVGLGQDYVGAGWTTPSLTRWRMKKLTLGARGDSCTVALFTRSIATGIKICEFELDSFTTGPVTLDMSKFPPIGALTDLVFRGKAASGTAIISVRAEMERGYV